MAGIRKLIALKKEIVKISDDKIKFNQLKHRNIPQLNALFNHLLLKKRQKLGFLRGRVINVPVTFYATFSVKDDKSLIRNFKMKQFATTTKKFKSLKNNEAIKKELVKDDNFRAEWNSFVEELSAEKAFDFHYEVEHGLLVEPEGFVEDEMIKIIDPEKQISIIENFRDNDRNRLNFRITKKFGDLILYKYEYDIQFKQVEKFIEGNNKNCALDLLNKILKHNEKKLIDDSYLEDGLTIDQYIELHEKYHINYNIYNILGELQASNKFNRHTTNNVMCALGHVYKVPFNKHQFNFVKKQLHKRVFLDNIRKNFHAQEILFCGDIDELFLKISTGGRFITNLDSLIIKQRFLNDKILPNINYSKLGDIRSFSTNNSHIIINDLYHITEKLSVFEYVGKYIDLSRYKSNYIDCGEYDSQIYPYEPISGKYHVIDIIKAYSNALANPYYFDYCVFDDEHGYDPIEITSIADLKSGMYTLLATGKFPLDDNYRADADLVKYLLDSKKISLTDIYSYKKPIRTFPKNTFTKFVDDLYLNSGTDDVKKILNRFIGTLGKKTTYNKKTLWTNSSSELNYILQNYENARKVDEINGLYEINITTPSNIILNGYLPIHKKILDNALIGILKLIDCAKNNNNTVSFVHTDSVYIPACEDISKIPISTSKTALGEYHYLGIKNVEDNNNVKNNFISYQYERDFPLYGKYISARNFEKIKKKEILADDSGCLLTGPAGSGKSTLLIDIMGILDIMGKKYKVFSYTNCSARNIRGVTFHKGLCLNIDSQYTKNLYNYVKHLDYIIIDEFSLITKEILQILTMIKRTYLHINFIMGGDIHQLNMPQQHNKDLENEYLKFLCDYRLCELKKIHRSDNNTEIINEILFNEDFDIDKFILNLKKPLELRGVCYFNKTRKKCNLISANKSLKNVPLNKRLFIEKTPGEPLTQNIHIGIHFPVCIYKADKKLNLIKGDCGYITDIKREKELITIKFKENTITLTKFGFKSNIIVNFYCTYFKCQGLTFDYKYSILDYQKLDKRALYTSISRATDKNNYLCNFALQK